MELTEDPHAAEVIVINTCAFIKEAQEEAITAILEAAQMKTAGCCRNLFVCGCLPQRFQDELSAELPEVDGFFGINQWREILDQIAPPGKEAKVANPYLLRRLQNPRHYAYLRLADGCNRGCSYCVIPTIRGRYQSRPPEEILAEAHRLAELGVKELLPVAQELNSYGHDLGLGGGNFPLMALLGQLSQVEGIEWIRPLYLHPPACDEALFQYWASQPKLCHYLDLPIEHASDRILRAMNRGGNKKQLKQIIAAARKWLPQVVLRTSIIVGFPGETPADFAELLDFVREIRFHRLGSFEYSREIGTPAARIKGQLPKKVKVERRELLMEVQREIAAGYNEVRLGTTEEVFIDEYDVDSGHSLAHSRSELPELDGAILIPGQFQVSAKLKVRFESCAEYDLIARPLDEKVSLAYE